MFHLNWFVYTAGRDEGEPVKPVYKYIKSKAYVNVKGQFSPAKKKNVKGQFLSRN